MYRAILTDMQKFSLSQVRRVLQDHLPIEALKSALFVRNVWFSIRYFQRNRQYRKGIGEVIDGMPIPPAALISNVAGIPDVAWYLVSGKNSAEDIIRILRRNQIHLCWLKTILDFGCGSARVTRHMLRLENAVLYGVDVDEKAIQWCQQHFNIDHFRILSHQPLLEFPDSNFDLVYAISVFTHFPTNLVIGWLNEIKRVIKPGGYLVFTTIGEKYIQYLSESERGQFISGLPIVKTPRSINLCRAYHPYDFVAKELKKGFTIVDFAAAGAKGTPGQDLYLLRKT
jgi:SAM-dependent methyltransferase